MIKNLLFTMLLLSMTACVVDTQQQNPKYRSTLVTSGDLSFLSSGSSTFAWHPSLAKVAAGEKFAEAKVISHMQASITKIMHAKGFELVSLDESPNLLVGYGLALESDMSDAEILQKAGLVAGLSTAGVDAQKHEKGSVLVALFRPTMPEPAWRVLAQGFTDTELSPQQRQQRFDDLISLMLGSIPNI